DLSPGEMEALVKELGGKPYRAKQLLHSAWRSGARTFDEMTALPAAFRRALADEIAPRALAPAGELVSADNLTIKRLHRTWDGHEIESVWMAVPAREGSKRRLTVCISSQIGCAFGCAFCASGKGGLVRGLRAAEIAEQAVAPDGGRPSHVVIMGMGEPLANYDEVLAAIRILNAPWGPGIGARRITVSTIGVVSGIRRLAGEGLELELAISLHAPNDDVRKVLCPRAPSTVAEIVRAARHWARKTKRLVTFEYALASGVNDSPAQARELAKLIGDLPAKVNLIPLNPVEGSGLAPSPRGEVRRFRDALASGGVNVTVRRERGADVDAACGQLRWRRLGGRGGE
ncbi:MAG: dual-specificity RNA methyltransferase RlmN, partial [Planctomycetota bacterium]